MIWDEMRERDIDLYTQTMAYQACLTEPASRNPSSLRPTFELVRFVASAGSEVDS